MFRPPGQKRASAPKVRTGCLTCKARRVKCDESKPRCNQCTKSSRDCQWKRESVTRTARVLVPLAKTYRIVISKSTSLFKSPSQSLHFNNEREAQYLHTYRNEVQRELTGALLLSPWFHSVLRACHVEPTILHAAVAIGALNKSWKLAHFAKHGPTATRAINFRAAETHKEHALTSYSKALSGLRRLTMNVSDPTNLRHILIGCLLVHCMEAFLQSPGTAFKHSAAGYSLLVNYITSNPQTSQKYKWTASPDPAIIDDAIFHEHMRLQNDRALSNWSPSRQYHQATRNKGEIAVLEMPTTFSTLDEAQDHGELLMHRTTHLIAEIQATVKETHLNLLHPLDYDLPGHIVDVCDLAHLQSVIKLRATYLAELYSWRDSFAPLLARLSILSDTRLVCGSAMQQNHVLDGIVTLYTMLEPKETAYEQYHKFQTEILALIVRSMKLTPHIAADLRPTFTVSSTFHRPIANVAAGSRDKALREQAVAIMCRMSPRDGDMLRQRYVFSHKYVVALEERNRNEAGEIPDHLRYRIVGTYTHGKENYCTTVVMRRSHRGPAGDIYPSTKRYRWRTWTEEQAEASSFEVGNLVSDLEGEEVVDREREEEIKKWPKGLAKPAWIKWWEIFHELPKTPRDRKLRPLVDVTMQDIPALVPSSVIEDEWLDIPDQNYISFDQEQVSVEQIGGFGGWVPYLDVFPDQDLGALHQQVYLPTSK